MRYLRVAQREASSCLAALRRNVLGADTSPIVRNRRGDVVIHAAKDLKEKAAETFN